MLVFEDSKVRDAFDTEAEYVALADTIKEVIFLRYVWSFILPGLGSACITVFEDNKA